MNICEVALLKLIEQEKISEASGKIIHTLLKHKALTLMEIEQFTGIPYSSVVENVAHLLAREILKKEGNKMGLNNGMDVLDRLIETALPEKLEIAR